MRAVLLWTTLLFGAPLPASAERGDPASEEDRENSRLAQIAARIIDLGVPLLEAATRADFLTALDLAVLKLDFPALVPGNFADTDLQEIGRTVEQQRAEALLEFEAAVSPRWRGELRAGLARASALAGRLAERSDLVESFHVLTDEGAPTVQQMLGDLDRPFGERRAALQYFRGCLCAGALAAAASRDSCIPDDLAELILPMWLDSLDSLDRVVRSGSFQALPTEAALELSPIGAVLLAFQCGDGERLANHLTADPSLPSVLSEVAAEVRQFFPDPGVGYITLRPSWNPEGDTEEPTLLVAISTTQDVTDAEACLERFDRVWWLDRSLQVATRIVVDIRFV